jgi:hypothetical protein
MPTFAKGEEVVLFLEKTQRNWALTGLSQGKFSIYVGDKGRKLVRRKLAGVHYVGFSQKGQFRNMPRPVDRAAWALTDLLSELRVLVQAALIQKPKQK